MSGLILLVGAAAIVLSVVAGLGVMIWWAASPRPAPSLDENVVAEMLERRWQIALLARDVREQIRAATARHRSS